MSLPFWLLRLLPMWECEKCGSVFDRKDNQRLTCAKCGGKRRPPSKDPIENAVLQIFSKFANIKFKPLKTHEERSGFAHHILAPKLKTKQLQALFIFFTTIFEDGFESGDFSAWTGTNNSTGETSAVEATDPYSGTYNAKFSTNGSEWNEYAYCYKNITGQTILYARAYFKETTTFPPSWHIYNNIISFHNQSNGEIAHVGLIYEGAVYWYLGYLDAGTFKDANNGEWWTGASPSTGTYYCVELYAKIDGSAGEYKVYIDGTERISVTGKDTDDRGNIDQVRAGLPSSKNNNVHAHRIDCVVVADAYIGPEAEVTVKTVTDSLSLTDSVLRNKTFSVSDAIGLSDMLLRNKTLVVTDSVGANDAVLGNKSPLIVADAVSLSELINVITEAMLKTVTDQVSLSDGAKVLKQLGVSDAVTLVDGVNVTERILRVLDAVALADTLHVNKFLQVTEAISLAEVVQVGVEGVKKTKLFLILGELAVQLTGD